MQNRSERKCSEAKRCIRVKRNAKSEISTRLSSAETKGQGRDRGF